MFPKSSPRETTNVLSHWYTFIDGVRFSASDFYKTIEDELKARQVPRLQISRVDFHEGSIASDKRIYLRLARERYAFDVCAAPFGRGYFFSFRLIEKNRSWFQFISLLFVAGLIWIVATKNNDGNALIGAVWVLGSVVVLWGISIAIQFQFAEGNEPMDADAFLLNTAVIGTLYERARKDTYFRHDTRLLFHTLISELVKKHAEALISAKGVTLVRTYEYSPVLGNAYNQGPKAIPQVSDAVA